MTRRLQVFISSTYLDLKNERQSALEIILTARCIPAGMEIFTGEGINKLEMIYKWIDESDIFLLILGSRYGSICKDKNLSYTELEYLYAKKRGKQMILCVMDEKRVENKYKDAERDDRLKKIYLLNADKQILFRNKITEGTVNYSYFDNSEELRRIILSSLYELKYNPTLNFIGWIWGNEIPNKKILQNFEVLNKSGIKQIYTNPRDKDIKNEIATAKIIYFFTYASDKFIYEHKKQLIEALNNGASIYILFTGIEHLFDKHLNQPIITIMNEIKIIANKANKCKKIEIRLLNIDTDFNNSILIYSNAKNNVIALIKLLLYFNNDNDCIMIEIDKGLGLKDCIANFKEVWNSSKNNTVYKKIDSKEEINKEIGKFNSF